MLAEDSVTEVPTSAPGPLRVIVPVAESPPGTGDGLTVTVRSLIGLIVIVAVWEDEFNSAVMSADCCSLTPVVLTVNVVLVAPAGTVTELGTVAIKASLDNAIATPPAGAAAPSVMVAVEVAPPTTVVGLTDKEATVVAFAQMANAPNANPNKPRIPSRRQEGNVRWDMRIERLRCFAAIWV